MATAVFAIIGNIIAPGIGGIIGAAIGSVTDNKVLFKQKSGPREIHIPEVQSAAEGGPALYCIGQHCRVRGQIIWMSDIHLIDNKQVTSVALALARNEIDSVRSVFAEGYDIYNGAGSSTVTEAHNFTITHQLIRYLSGQNLIDLWYQSFIDSKSASGLAPFRPGVKDSFTMRFWADAGNNWGFGGGAPGNAKGTIRKIGAKSSSFPTPSVDHRMWARRRRSLETPIVNVDEVPNSTAIELSQNFPPVNPEFLSAFTLFKGTPGQLKSSEILSFERDDETPAYEETAYVTLQHLILTQFGLRLPELVAIVSQSSTPRTLPQAVADIMTFGGWDNGIQKDLLQYDTSRLDSSLIVRGYTMQGNLTIAKRLEPLQIAFDVWAQVRDGVLIFFHSKNAREFNIPEEAWGTDADGGNEPRGLQFSRRSQEQLPSAVTVHFVDHVTFDDASVHENRTSLLVTSPDDLVIDLRMLTMSEDEAKKVAYRMLHRPHQEAEDVSGTLPPNFYYLLENDIINTSFEGASVRALCTKLTQTPDGYIEFEGYVWMPDPPQDTI